MSGIPVVSIIGRQNVGKSSLLNVLARKRISIVDPKPGVTRDRVSALISHSGVLFECVDTGGLGLDLADELSRKVVEQIRKAIEQSALVLFVVDAQAGLLPFDAEIAAMVRRFSAPVVLVVNKVDNESLRENISEFDRLGFGDPVALSAAHRRGVDDVLERILSAIPRAAEPAPAATTEGINPVGSSRNSREAHDRSGQGALEETSDGVKIAIVGRRNVGKSSFINAVAGEERVIVSEIPGTTRDAVDVVIRKEGKVTTLIDTAGLRKKNRVEDSVEFFSHARTAEAVRRADVVLFMMDITADITFIDKQIAKMIESEFKPVVLVLNKWDKVDSIEVQKFMDYVTRVLPVFTYAPVSITSAVQNKNVWETLQMAEDLYHQSSTMIPTPRVNEVIEKAQRRRSLPLKGARVPKIYYATQVSVRPPHFVLFVNDKRLFGPDTLRFLVRRIQEDLPFSEVPIRMVLRNRERVSLEKLKSKARRAHARG